MKRKFMVLCAVIFFLALGMQTDIQPAYAAENTTIAGEDATAVEQTYSVTVIFKSNKGKGSMSSQVVTSNTTIKLKANKFKRTGYTFTGWNTKSNGKGTSYANKADASSLATPNNNGKTIMRRSALPDPANRKLIISNYYKITILKFVKCIKNNW